MSGKLSLLLGSLLNPKPLSLLLGSLLNPKPLSLLLGSLHACYLLPPHQAVA